MSTHVIRASGSHRRRLAGQNYLYFNGASTYIDFGSDASLDNLCDAAVTFEFYFQPLDYGPASYQTLFHKGYNNSYRIHIGSGGNTGITMIVDCAVADSSAKSGTAAFQAACPWAHWRHVAFTWDDATYNYPRVWLHGVEQTPVAPVTRNGAVIADAANNLIVGRRSAALWFFHGGMAAIRLSNTIRYTANFTPFHRLNPPALDGNTVEQWNLDEGGGTIARAQVNAANDATIHNGVWRTSS